MVNIHSVYTRSVDSEDPNWLKDTSFPPAGLLVGVELNPGPPKKGKKLPGKEKRGKKKEGRSNGMLGASSSSNMGVAFANATVIQSPTYIRRSAAPFHPKWGAGVSVTGRQYLTSFVTTAISSDLFSGNSPASANVMFVSPDAFNGRLALEARTYSRYLFKMLRLIYTPRVATTQAGEFVLAYLSDGAASSIFTPSFAACQDSEAAIVASFHNGGQQLVWDVPIPQGISETYICEADAATLAGQRTSYQGQIQGYPDVTSIGALTMGNLSVEYEILLYCPCPDLGFTLQRMKTPAEAEFLKKAQEQYRRSLLDEEPKSSSVQSHCPASSPCIQCGTRDDYVDVRGRLKPPSL